MMGLLAAIALSSFVFTASPKGTIDINSVRIYPASHPRSVKKQDLAFVNFNITADLTPLFHWNTKQLFLYLEAEYTNTQGVKNEVVIWDRIVRRKEDAVINVAGGKNKYMFRELSSAFKKAPPAHYSLKYNVMPYVGALTYGEAARKESVAFPDSQSRV